MSRTVFCVKYKQELDGLEIPPMPGPKGAYLFENVSKKAWSEWLSKQTMLINEKRLNMMDPSARSYLTEQMEKFLANEEIDIIEGYVPQGEKNS